VEASCDTHAGSITYWPVGAEGLQHEMRTTSVHTLLQESVREPFANWLIELGKCRLPVAGAQLAASSVDAAQFSLLWCKPK